MTRRILIVDDDDTIRTSLAEALSDDGATIVCTAESADAALGLLTTVTPDVVLSDVRMPDIDGIESCVCCGNARPRATS